VALGASRVARPLGRVHCAAELHALVADFAPDVVAIDAPPAWAGATRRACERELSRRGISVFSTPDEATGAANPFYRWMHTGFAMFAGAAPCVTVETFPHAIAIALRGVAPEQGLLKRPAVKRAWRCEALTDAGVDHANLRTIDEIDAALCAFVGLRFLKGDVLALGDPAEGVIVVPKGLPVRRPRQSTNVATRTP